MPLQIRRGTEAERLAMNAPLAAGELLYVTDNQRVYVGNSSTIGGVPVTGYTNDDAQDAAAGLFTNGNHSGISFTYNQGLNRIDATVSLENFSGPIEGNLIGSVFADDSTKIIDGTDGTINLNRTINDNVVPAIDAAYDLGSTSYKFKDIYLSGLSSIFLGDATITSAGSVVDLPLGSTINGVPISSGTGEGVVEGSTYKINIAAEDSAFMLNSDTGVITAAGGFFGNLTGNVNGVITGNAGSTITGDVTGNLTGNVLASGGVTVVNVANRSATLTALNIESFGSINSPSLIVSSPSVSFVTETVSSTTPFVSFYTPNSANQDGVSISLTRSRGSLISPDVILTGDEIGSIVSSAFDGTDFVLTADIILVVDGTVSTGVVPSRIDFRTSDSTGAIGTKLSIKSATVEFSVPPALPVIADDTARSTSIPSPVKGMMILMEAGTTPAATNTVQAYNGTGWVNLS